MERQCRTHDLGLQGYEGRKPGRPFHRALGIRGEDTFPRRVFAPSNLQVRATFGHRLREPGPVSVEECVQNATAAWI